ncbi:hypothetical protein [Collinsella tanakaei]|uniref:hypothetical protein n=1 Tax=Collinsella tanakaei TaxID=626935 RepID=UPI0025A422A6|nr:hypothetical protein [Collinsella tanakaei]MDM8300226.1 hypothetical protein [Collinsella tanakaei]
MQCKEIQTAEVPREAQVIYEVDDTPGPMDTIMRFRFFIIGLLVVLGLVSAFPLRAVFSSPDTYATSIATLDDKKNNVLGMVAASTGASAAITAIPDDVGTPIADKLMDLSTNLMLVLAVIYLEKYLLTVFGFAAFGILIPAALACFVISLVLYCRSTLSGSFALVARKLLVLALVLWVTVPAGVAVTNMIDQTYEISYATESVEGVEAEAEAEEDTEEGGSPIDFIISIPEKIADAATGVADEMLSQVNRLIEGVAVMIVTSCIIPILVLLFFLWMANLLLGINVDAPRRMISSRAQRLKVSRADMQAMRQSLPKRAPRDE